MEKKSLNDAQNFSFILTKKIIQMNDHHMILKVMHWKE